MIQIGGKQHKINPWDFYDKPRNARWYADLEMNRTLTMFKWSGLPDSLPELELEKILQFNGYGIVTEYDNKLVALWGGLSSDDGCNVYYFPKGVRVDNPWAKINRLYIIEDDQDAVLVRNDPLCKGLMPLIRKYAGQMVEADITLLRSLINYRAMYLASGSSDREKDSINAFIAGLEAGKPAAVMEEELSEGIKTQPYGQGTSGQLTQVIELYQYLKGNYNNALGLSDNINMKRERLTEGEAEINEMTLRPLIDSMLEERQKAAERINKRFGTNISVEFDSSWAKYNPTPVVSEDEEAEIAATETPDENENFSDEEVAPESESGETEVVDTAAEQEAETEAPVEAPAEQSETDQADVNVTVEVNVNSEESQTDVTVEEDNKEEEEKDDGEE